MAMLSSIWDWLVLLIVILVLFGGAKKIPELARGLGRAAGEFRRGQIEVEKELQEMQQAAQKPADAATVSGGTVDGSKRSIEERIAALEKELEELKKMRDGSAQ